MGWVVYLAEDANGRRVALKLIRSELADDPAFRSRFRREVQAGQRVGGICTARYIDADVESDRPYLVTEYVEGGNLADCVATRVPLPMSSSLDLPWASQKPWWRSMLLVSSTVT